MANANADTRDNFKVVIKSRPLIKRERDARLSVQWKIVGDTIEGLNPLCSQRYTFDHIYDENSTTQDLYDDVARPIVAKSVEGFNGTIFAYGQTSSGKTYTMLGDKRNVGVIRLAARQIFSDITTMATATSRTFIVKVNYLEIYNEKVYDLLNDRKEIKIQEFPNGELKFGCTGQKVKSDDDILKLVEAGNNHRKVAETNMNVQSSRSHAILQIGIESVLDCDGASKVSVLNLVDLAGSERADSTGATGERLKESANINKSLLTLSIVINKLSNKEESDGHIGYRDSKLTRILQTSLGGNAMTVMICAITPAALEETNLTLGFATRAKKIENKPVINETVSDAVEVKRAKKQIMKLEAQLEAKQKEIDEYRKNENELLLLQQMIIQGPKKTSSSANLRRRTWAPSSRSISPLGSISEDKEGSEKERKPNYQMLFGPLGRTVECSEEDWNDTLREKLVEMDENEMDFTVTNVTNPFKLHAQKPHSKLQEIIQETNNGLNATVKTPNNPQARKSLLKTPKSVKHILNRNNDITTHSSVASPIALDKDNRIRMLEQELEELRHFGQTESMVDSSNVAAMQTEIDEKSNEITTLNEQLNDVHQKLSEFESRLESAQREMADARKEKDIAIQAKVEAEQNMTSIEFEYEQHKLRATRREKELVEQLDNIGNDETIKILKEKVSTMTEKANSLETQLWQDAQTHNAEIENLNAMLIQGQEKLDHVKKQMDKLNSLQHEYDDTSAQLMDSIQENDQLKKTIQQLKDKNNDLTKKVDDLSAELSPTNKQYEAVLREKDQVNISKMRDLEEKHNKEVQALQEKLEFALAKVKDITKYHSDETKKLEEIHRKELTELTQKQESAMHELEQDIAEQKEDIFNIKTEYDDLLAHCNNLEHTNTLLENACTQARMTVDLIMKETELLRKGYNDLKMSTAVQELEHLKLQRTISEYDESMNFTVFNETVANSVTNNVPSINSNNTQSQSIVDHTKLITKVCEKEDDSLLNEFVENEKKLEELTEQLIQKQQQLESANLKMVELETEFANLQKETQDNLIGNQQKVSDLEDMLANYKKSIDDHEVEVQKIRQEFNEKLTEKDVQLKNLSAELVTLQESIEKKCADHECKVSELKKAMQLQTEVSEHSEKVHKEELNKVQSDLKKQLTDKEHELKNVSSKISELESLVCNQVSREVFEDLNKKLADKERESKDASNKIAELESLVCNQVSREVFEDLNKKLADKEQESKNASNKIAELENIVSAQVSREVLENLNVRLAEKETKLKEMQETLMKTEEKSISLQEISDKYEILKKESKENLAKKEQEISNLKETIANQERSQKHIDQEHINTQRDLKDQLAQKEKDLEKIANEIVELKEVIGNYERMKKNNQEKCGELQHRITVLEEEQECLEKLNKKLQSQIESQTEEMNDVQRQLTTMKQSKEKLEFEKQKLVEEMNAIKAKRYAAHSSEVCQSPRRRDNRDVDIDSLLNENKTLKSVQTELEKEVQELRKSTSTVRKIKRQSIHDDTRRMSGFDSTMIDLGTQTDPVNEACACSDMAKQIVKLKQELVIIEAKYATFRLSTGVDDLQAEVKALKQELSTTKSKLSRLNIDYENILDKHEKLKLKSVMAMQKTSSIDATVQTDAPWSAGATTFVDQMDWDKIRRRTEKYKKAYEDVVQNYNKLKAKYEQQKIEHEEESAKSLETARLWDEIQPKYSNMKRLCNTRWDQIQEFQRKIANFEKNETALKAELSVLQNQMVTFKETTDELIRYKRKYEAAKDICDKRKMEIERLRKLATDGNPNNENVPVNK